MTTIVEYTDHKIPVNQYPKRFISPSHSSACCSSQTEEIGPLERDDHWMYRYKRCRACGFTVRLVLRELPDAGLAPQLAKALSSPFQSKIAA